MYSFQNHYIIIRSLKPLLVFTDKCFEFSQFNNYMNP